MNEKDMIWKRCFTFDNLKLVLPTICELASKYEHIRICQDVEKGFVLEVGKESTADDAGHNEVVSRVADKFTKERRILRSLK